MKVLPFNSTNLCSALSNNYTGSDLIFEKRHFLYLEEYLEELDARTILIEYEYLSKSFLSDFSFYYARCFVEYPKFCSRIHFFNEKITATTFKKALFGKSKILERSYLGHIVVKPIPSTIIGPTILKTYNRYLEDGERVFFGTRSYKAHLFGEVFELDTLAFQEQDKVVSACATTAVWSMLHKAVKKYDLKIKTPSEITRKAGITAVGGGRLFPNKGLTTQQMCEVISDSGLVTEIRHIDSHEKGESQISYLKELILAYSKLEIPLILNLKVPTEDIVSYDPNHFGDHAVTICGYKLNTSPKKIEPKDNISLFADDLEKIYVHDDQWGPFARIKFNIDSLTTPWTEFDNSLHRPSHATELIVPLYPSIRISYDDVYLITRGIDAVLRLAFEDTIKEDFKWEIFIEDAQKFKQRIKQSKLKECEKYTILDMSFPKYIWTASCFVKKTKVFEYVFDTTSLSSSMYGLVALGYESKTKKYLKEFLDLNASLCSYFENDHCVDFLDFMKFTY